MNNKPTFVKGKRGIAANIFREALKSDKWTDEEWKEAEKYLFEYYMLWGRFRE